jgi:hypothetical protein
VALPAGAPPQWANRSGGIWITDADAVIEWGPGQNGRGSGACNSTLGRMTGQGQSLPIPARCVCPDRPEAEIGCVTKTKRTPDSDSRGRSDGLSPLRMRPVAPWSAVGRSLGPIRSADPRFRAVSAADKQLQIKQTWPGQARPGHPDPHLSKWSENAPSSRRGNVLWTNSSRSLRSLRDLSHNLSPNLSHNLSRNLGPVVRRAAAFRRSPWRRHRTSPSSHRRFPLHRE